MNYIAFLALMCVLLQAAYAAPSDKVDCSQVDEIIDDLGSAQGLTANNDKYKIQTTVEEHTKRCTEMADAIKSLKKYNIECYTSLTRQVLSAVLKTRSKFNEERCNNETMAQSDAFKESIEAAKCVTENSLEAVKAAEKKAVLTFQVLYDANIPEDDLRISRTCCSILEAKKLFLDATKEKCSKHIKVYTDYIDSYTEESMSLVCPVESKLNCTGFETIKIDGVTEKSKFFLTPLIKLVKTLDH